jgi:hypothetical protein
MEMAGARSCSGGGATLRGDASLAANGGGGGSSVGGRGDGGRRRAPPCGGRRPVGLPTADRAATAPAPTPATPPSPVPRARRIRGEAPLRQRRWFLCDGAGEHLLLSRAVEGAFRGRARRVGTRGPCGWRRSGIALDMVLMGATGK